MSLVTYVCQGAFIKSVMTGINIIMKSRDTQSNACMGHIGKRHKLKYKKNKTKHDRKCRFTEWIGRWYLTVAVNFLIFKLLFCVHLLIAVANSNCSVVNV